MSRMKTLQLAIAMLLVLTAGGSGYFLRGLHDNPLTMLPTSLPELDFFISEQSFSEVANAKALLQALSERYISEVRVLRYLDGTQSSSEVPSPFPADQEPLSVTIDVLQKGVEAFEGTGQELEVAYDLLLTLKSAGQYDRWLEVYLRALYEHPTHGLVEVFARDAVSIGRAVGRESEVVRGFRHLSDIPIEFKAKQRVQQLLAPPGNLGQLSQNDEGRSPIAH